MLAVRSALDRMPGARDWTPSQPEPDPDPADWLSLQQAACELDVSISTLRRMIRKGKVRHRIVPRHGGYGYLVYIPNSLHAQGAAHGRAPTELRAAERARIRDLEDQVERLSNALARALRQRQTLPPDGAPDAASDDDAPYARYRWLARKRTWWPLKLIGR